MLVHTCIRVRDIDASVRFYEALGFEKRGKLDFGAAYNIYMGLPGDADTGDGAGASNATRTAQANRLLAWITSSCASLRGPLSS